MNHIVITGGSRGIGQALAHEFLHQGCRVSLTNRNRETVEATVAELVASTGNKACHGFVCDGRIMEGMSIYGTSKNAVSYFYAFSDQRVSEYGGEYRNH